MQLGEQLIYTELVPQDQQAKLTSVWTTAMGAVTNQTPATPPIAPPNIPNISSDAPGGENATRADAVSVSSMEEDTKPPASEVFPNKPESLAPK